MTSEPTPPAIGSTQKPKRRRITWRKRICFSAIILILFVGFIELVCRYGVGFLGQKTVRELRAERDFINRSNSITNLLPAEVNHPYLGWTRNPDANRPDVFEGRKYDPNEFGLMDTSTPLRKRAADKVIIAVIGGSVAWQMTVSGEGRFLRELQRQPRFQGKSIELVRLAVSGYKQPQQLLLLTYLLSLGAEFDILVNIDGYNEVALHPAENAAAGIFAAYPRAWKVRQLETVNPRQIQLMADFIATKSKQREWDRVCSTWPLQDSATVNFLWTVIHERYTVACGNLQEVIMKGRRENPGFQVVGPPQKFSDATEMFEYLIEYWAQCSRQIQQVCQANGIEYHHVLPPNQHLTGSKPIVDPEEIRIALLETEASQAANRGYPLLVKKGAQLRSTGLKFHDLSQLFSETRERIYVDDCCHYNPTGNERLGAAVAALLNEK